MELKYLTQCPDEDIRNLSRESCDTWIVMNVLSPTLSGGLSISCMDVKSHIGCVLGGTKLLSDSIITLTSLLGYNIDQLLLTKK